MASRTMALTGEEGAAAPPPPPLLPAVLPPAEALATEEFKLPLALSAAATAAALPPPLPRRVAGESPSAAMLLGFTR
jgi:hypothetical protein